ncbi:uncharacterized protein LOC127845521 isoform X4 [Dreissena polymorpha]|uniref:uncharacterized protein LOC127845521 isoform X4 n=1 Tax=Dreissena polymorpha TaxID=45954 RepID=UPI0022644860|nr:uncharacterized protein LOC127845521 isoform X4 [Dreissena polymorpha]
MHQSAGRYFLGVYRYTPNAAVNGLPWSLQVHTECGCQWTSLEFTGTHRMRLSMDFLGVYRYTPNAAVNGLPWSLQVHTECGCQWTSLEFTGTHRMRLSMDFLGVYRYTPNAAVNGLPWSLQVHTECGCQWTSLEFTGTHRMRLSMDFLGVYRDHEWTKHGVCAKDVPATNGEYNYFRKGLELNRKYRLLQILEVAGITPNQTTNYTIGQVHDAVKNTTGVEAVFMCYCVRKRRMHPEKRYILTEIQICLDKTKFTPVACPNVQIKRNRCPGFSKCPKHFSYPPIQYGPDETIYFERFGALSGI